MRMRHRRNKGVAGVLLSIALSALSRPKKRRASKKASFFKSLAIIAIIPAVAVAAFQAEWPTFLSGPAPSFFPNAACDDILRSHGPSLPLKSAPRAIPLCRKGYASIYDPARKTPVIVIEILAPETAQKVVSRQNDFRSDPDLPRHLVASPTDYAGSGYDRGHMAAAENMAWDAQAMSESFYMSNMAPQVGQGLNRGIWASLERHQRDLVKRYGRPIAVYTGPLYSNTTPKMIGPSNIHVPDGFWKAAVDLEGRGATCYVMPNQAIGHNRYREFIRPCPEVNRLTGLNLPALR